MDREKFEIGIRPIDSILGGGLPSGTVTAMVGEAGSGKIELSLRFISHGFDNEEPGLFVTFTTIPMTPFLFNLKDRKSFKGIFMSEDPLFLNTTDLAGVDLLLGLIEDGAVSRMVLDRPEVLGLRGVQNWYNGLENVLQKAREMEMATMILGGPKYTDINDYTSEGMLELSSGPDGRRSVKVLKWPFSNGGRVTESEVGEWTV
jgi:hypothetical protein